MSDGPDYRQQEENEEHRWCVERGASGPNCNQPRRNEMQVNDMFPSKYLKAADLPDGKMVPVTIQSVEQRDMPGGELKWCLFFVGKEKGMVLNRTNAETISDLHGGDTNLWNGKPIELYKTRVQGPNGPTMGVRVNDRPAAGAAPATPQQASQDAQAPAERTDFDDDIPF